MEPDPGDVEPLDPVLERLLSDTVSRERGWIRVYVDCLVFVPFLFLKIRVSESCETLRETSPCSTDCCSHVSKLLNEALRSLSYVIER
ncbi:Heme A synthase, partial [Dissostichus eleginoides]